jgi:hypothetical protein
MDSLRPACCLVAALLCSGSAFAVDAFNDEDPNQSFASPHEDGIRRMSNEPDDLRIGATLQATPKITEDVSTPSGNVHYDWIGRRTTGGGVDLTYLRLLRATDHSRSGLLLGCELQYRYFNITPDSYGTSAGVTPNVNNNLAITLQQAGGDILFGWGTAALYTRYGEFDFELLGVVGGGLVWTETQVPGQNLLKRGAWSSWNVAPRLGVVWDDQEWNMGLHVDYVVNHGRTVINLPNGEQSTLHDKSSAPAATFEIGYRF